MGLRSWRAVATVVVLASMTAGCTPTYDPLPPVSNADVEAFLTKQADRRWEFLATAFDLTDRPQVERIRFVTIDEFPSVTLDCAKAAGIPGDTLTLGNGTVLYDNPTKQGQQDFQVILFECALRYPVDPRTFGMLSDAQLDYLYDFYLERTIPCLGALGKHVTIVPSRDDFKASYGFGWSPYYVAQPILTEKDYRYLRLHCEQPPSPFEGFRL